MLQPEMMRACEESPVKGTIIDWTEQLERWAAQLEQRRAEFIDMLAHDVRNRLFVILNYAEMLLERSK